MIERPVNLSVIDGRLALVDIAVGDRKGPPSRKNSAILERLFLADQSHPARSALRKSRSYVGFAAA